MQGRLAVIEDIHTRGEYTVHMMDAECVDTVVRNISAISFPPSLRMRM